MSSLPGRRRRKLRPRTAEEEDRDAEQWLQAYEETLMWLLYSTEGQSMLVALGSLPLGDSVRSLGLTPLDDHEATRDPDLEALFARIIDRELARWDATGHAFAAGAIGNLVGVVWNYSHTDPDTTRGLLRELVDLLPMPSDRGYVVFLMLMATLMAGLEGQVKPRRFVSSVALLGCDHRGTRLAVKVAEAGLA